VAGGSVTPNDARALCAHAGEQIKGPQPQGLFKSGLDAPEARF